MRNFILKFHFSFFLFLLQSVCVLAQSHTVWQPTSQLENYVLSAEKFKQLTANKNDFDSSFSISFPDGKGDVDVFKIVETQTMHPKLSKKYESIKTYSGVSKNNKRISFTFCNNVGIHGFVFGKERKTKITPKGNGLHKFELVQGESFTNAECNTINEVHSNFSFTNTTARDVNDSALRKYRLALSVSGEYSQSFLDGSEANNSERINKVMIAIVNSVNRLNGIFEVDLGIRLELVENNDQLIFLNEFSDPYSTGSNLNSELQIELDNTIGNDNYDVGHLYHKEPRVYGNAGCIACVCTAGQKGSAFTVHSDPTSDEINLIAAHEFGHQFGAYHTQSSSQCRSGINSEVEPGSGSTIMGYAGICNPNVQLIPDDYFNFTSIRDIAIWTINNSNCAEIISIQNSAPTVNAGNDKVIPISTAFILEAEAIDVDNDILTYCWEQNDSEELFSSNTPSSNQTIGPIFRSFPPSNSNKRYFPLLESVVEGNITPTWEVVPSVTRDINFVVTVRDNNTEGGQVSSDAIRISTTSDAGPFVVTSQNEANIIWTVGSEVTVTWDVANTDSFPVNTNEVDILLSTNGGETFDQLLVTVTNNGAVTFVLPDADATDEARIMIKAANNVFYALNGRNFTIEKSEFIITTNQNTLSSCNNSEAIFNLEYSTFLEFQETVSLSVQNLPEGITQELSRSVFSGSNNSGELLTLTLGSLDTVVEKEYVFSVIGISEETGIEKELTLSLTTFDPNFTEPTIITPSNNQNSISNENLLFEWDVLDDAQSYTLEVASDNSFSTLIISEVLESTTFITNNLERDSTYFWRINYGNNCGTSQFSTINSFKTACTAPNNIRAENITTNSAVINWNLDGSTSWEVEYGIQGFPSGTGEVIAEATNNFNLNNLNSGTTYDVYVRSSCAVGGFSSPSNVVSFTTLPDFCNGDKFFDSGGENDVYQNNEFTTTTIRPNNDSDRVTVLFETFNIESGFDELAIYDGETTNFIIGTFTGNSLEGQSFSSSDPTGALTFVFASDSSVTFEGWEASVICEARPNCLPPFNFSPRAIGGVEAVFEWQTQGVDSQWELEYGLQGFNVGSGSTLIVNQNEAVIENLLPFTTYEVYIKTICNSGGFSETEGPFIFTTREACPAPENIVFSNRQFTSIFVDWEDLGGISWNLEYGIRGFTVDEGISIELLESQFQIENLLSGTVYEMYLTANCQGDFSSTRYGPIAFNTPSNFCSGDRFYDSGGEFGNYSNGENTTTIIVPENIGDRVSVSFLSFNLESNFDFLSVYNGTTSQAPFLGKFSGSELLNQTIIANNDEGALTFVFASDGSVIRSGWEADVICQPTPNCNAPTNGTLTNLLPLEATISWGGNGIENTYTVEYAEAGFDLGLGIQQIVNSEQVVLENLIPETAYEVYIKANCEDGGFSDVLGPLSFTTPIACNIPQGFEVIDMTSTTANLDWNNSIDTTNGWEIEYGVLNFERGSGTLINAISDQFMLTDLIPQTTYEAYLRADCGGNEGKSRWSSPVVFTTACDVYTAPFIENFLVSNIPDCWSESSINSWRFNTSARDSNFNFIEDRNVLGNTNYAWIDGAVFNRFPFQNSYSLVTPFINKQFISNAVLEFSIFSSNPIENTYNKLEVFIDDGLGNSISVATVEEDTRFWRDFSIGLDSLAFNDVFRVRFEVSAPNLSSASYNDILIDEIKIINDSNCINPFEPRIVSSKGSSVVIDWQFSSQPENWEIVYGNENFEIENGNSVLTNLNTLEITNLAENTDYEFYIRSICGTDNQTDFIGPIAFNTRCNPFVAPYNEDFTGVSFNALPSCWSNLTSSSGVISQSDNNGNVIPDRDLINNSPNYLAIYNNPTNQNHQDYIYTPYVDISNLGVPSFQFSLYGNYFPFDDFRSLEVEFFDGELWNNIQLVSSSTEGWADYFIDLSNFNITNDVQVRFKQVNNNNSFTNNIFLVDNVVFDELPTCFSPSNIEVVELTSNSVSLIWQENNTATLWDVEYGVEGFELGEGINIEAVNTPNANISNLDSSTTYEFYIRSKCDSNSDLSRWYGPVTATTDVDFCSEGKFYDSGGEFGNYSNRENTTTTITPNSDNERVRVVFNTFSLETCCDRLQIYNGPTTNSPLIGSFNSLNSNNRTFISTHISGALTFTFISDGSITRTGWDANIFCEPTPNCLPPQNISVQNLGTTQADISVDLQGATAWEIEYGPSGFTRGEGITLSLNSESVTLENLQPSTTYQIYAKSICNEGGFSNETNAVSFRTNDQCRLPENLRNNLQSKSSLEFQWFDLTANNWEIEYGQSGFSIGNGIQLSSNVSSINIDDLDTDTAYDIYVRAVCSEVDKSEYVSLLNVRTAPDFCNSGLFVDSGGLLGEYSNNENFTTVIEPNSNLEVVSVTFNQFDIETGFDYLSVYDSDNTTSGFIGTFSGAELLNVTLTATNNSGALTFVFTSDEIIPLSGWSASVQCNTISTCITPENIQVADISASSASISWDDESFNTSWELQYGEEGFILGSGIIRQEADTQTILQNLNESTTYNVYVRGKCNLNDESNWLGPVSFTTTCNSSTIENELITNGSFECGVFGGWATTNAIDDGFCRVSFSVRQNSFDICTSLEDIFPTDGDYASFLSFDGEANDEFTLSQNFTIPNDEFVLTDAQFSFDFKVNYSIFSNALPRELITSFVIDGQETILDVQSFGNRGEGSSIDTSINIDVLEILNENKGKSVTLTFKAFIPESFSGPSKAMLDNVSLHIVKTNIETPIDVPINELEDDEVQDIPMVVVTQEPVDMSIAVSPNPSNGEFNVTSEVDIVAIEVYSIGGVRIKTIKPKGNQNSVDLRDLQSSMYILKINRVLGNTEITKIVIE